MVQAVFVDCTPELREVIERRGLEVPASVHIHQGNPCLDELVSLCAGVEVLLVEHTCIPPTLLDACPTVNAIVFMGTGAGTYIDLSDAARRGVVVRTTPGYGDQAVAEHALALLFAAARGIARSDAQIRRDIWQPAGGLQLLGLKLAVVGLGGIGTRLADIASALQMDVASWNRTPREHPSFNSDLDQVLSKADAVSLHLGLNADTTGLIGAHRLNLPNPGFILVNTARADLVDESALLAGLKSGQIGHAALDVFPEEPLPADNPYKELANVTLTAHMAYMTDAAYEELWLRTLNAYRELATELKAA